MLHTVPVPEGLVRRSRRSRQGSQHEQRVVRAGNDRVGLSTIVAEFNKRSGVVERFHDCSDLSTNEPVLRKITQQGDGAQHSGRLIAIFRLNGHYKTQQVKKRGTSSPFRTIHIVLTTARRLCRVTATSTCQRSPHPSRADRTAASSRAAWRRMPKSAASFAPRQRPTRSLVAAARMIGIEAVVRKLAEVEFGAVAVGQTRVSTAGRRRACHEDSIQNSATRATANLRIAPGAGPARARRAADTRGWTRAAGSSCGWRRRAGRGRIAVAPRCGRTPPDDGLSAPR